MTTGFSVFSQTNEERRERADKFFEKEKYVEATADYLHLLSLEPRSAELNFKYGTCLLYNSNKKSEGLRYLRFAVTDPNIDPRAWYFFGLALHLNYQFTEAQQSYGTYLNLTMGKVDKRYPVERQIQMCENGKRLLTTFTDIIVAEKQEIDNEKFFRIYTDENTIGGQILVTAKFQSKLDEKMGHVPIVHFPPNASAIYYSSYGNDLSSGLDIYIRRRLPNGEWGDPQPLPGMVNTPYDEDFPYMHPYGKYLYFSSTGHNSMGGYDIYLSKFDPNTNSFREPENVDFAISSPDDDFFYVVDSAFQNAYFASSRQSRDGMLHVYRVKVARVPLKEVIIMGEFISEVDPNMKSMDIQLTYHSNGKDVGLVRSNKVGKYSYVFPQGGKYNYLVSVDGLDEEFKFVVDLPFLDELRPLKQQIIHTKEEGKDVLKILNLFDEEVEGAEAIIADVIRKKAELDVNIDKFDVDDLEAEAKNKEILAQLGFENMSFEEVSLKLKELITINEEKKEIVEQITDNINSELLAKAERISDLNEIQAELTEKAMKTDDPITKHRLLSEAQMKEAEKNNLIEGTEALIALRNDVLTKVGGIEDNTTIQKLKVLSDQFSKLVEADSTEESIALLKQNETILKVANQGSPESVLTSYVARASELRTLIREETKKDQSYNAMIDNANQEINRLQGELENAKKKDMPAIERQISDKQEEIAMLKVDQKKSREKKAEYSRELSLIEQQIASLQNAMNTETHVAVNETKLEESLSKVTEIEEQVQEIDYQAEITKLEEESPSLFNSQAGVYETVKTDLARERKELTKNNDLSDAERLAREEELLQEAINDIDVRSNIVERELENNPTDELRAESERLNAYKEELTTELTKVEQELDSVKTENPDIAYSKNDLQKEIDPSFEKDIKEINNSGRSELEKSTEVRGRIEEHMGRLNAENEALTKSLENDPYNGELTARKEMLNELISENNNKLEAAKSREEGLIAQNTVKAEDPSAVIPGFSERLKEANELASLSDRLQAEKELLTELDQKIISAVKQLDKDIKKDPENTALIRRKEALSLLQNETNDRLSEIDEQLKGTSIAANNEDLTDPNTFVSEYTTKKNRILSEQGEELEKTEALIALERELLNSLTERETSLRKEAQNGSDSKIEENLVAVKELRKQVQDNFAQLEEKRSELNVLSSSTYKNEEALITELDPNYSSKRNELLNDSQLNETKRNNALIELNKALLNEADELIEKLETQAENNPNNASVEVSFEMVYDLIERLEDENKQLSAARSNDMLANELVPSYIERKEDALSLQEGSSKDKELYLLETELSSAIETELQRVNSVLSNNPNDETLLTRKRDLLALEAENYRQLEELKGSVVTTYKSEEELRSSLLSEKVSEWFQKDVNAMMPGEKLEFSAELQEALKEIQNKKERLKELQGEELTKAEENITWIERLENELNDKIVELKVLDTDAISSNDLVINYDQKRKEIETNDQLNQTERLSELNKLDATLIANAEKEVKSLDKQLKKNPENTSLQLEKDQIQQIISAAESRIAENDQLLAARNISPENNAGNSSELIESILRGYADRRSDLVAKNDTDAILALEYELLEALRSKESALQKSNATEGEVQKVADLYADQRTKVQQLVNDSISRLDEKELDEYRASLVKNYDQRESELKQENNVDELIALEDELQNEISDQRDALERKQEKSPSLEIEIELAKLNRLEKESKDKIASYRSPELVVNSEKEAYLNELKKESQILDLNEAALVTIEELKAADKALISYRSALSDRLDQVKAAMESSPSDELELERNWLSEEMKDVDARRLGIADRITVLESGDLATNEKKAAYINELRETSKVSDLKENELKTIPELKNADRSLAEYEVELQKIEASIHKQLKKSPSQALQDQLSWIQEEKANVEERRKKISISIGNLESGVVTESSEKETFLNDVRSASQVEDLNENNLKTTAELTASEEALQQYENELSERIQEIVEKIKTSPSTELEQQRSWLVEEKENIQQRRRRIRVMIGELETEVIAEEGDTRELDRSIREKEDKLNDPNVTEAEKKELRAEILELSEERAEIRSEQLNKEIKRDQNQLENTLNEVIKGSDNESVFTELRDLAVDQGTREEEELAEINKIDDPQQKAYELEKYRAQQEQKQEDIRSIALNEQVRTLESENDIQITNKEELEERKRRFVVRLGELTREIDKKEDEITSAKKKDVPSLTQEKELLENEYKVIKDEIERIDQHLITMPDEQPDLVENAMTTEIGFQEERKIAASEGYRNYEPVGILVFEKAEQIRTLEDEVEQLRTQLSEQALLNFTNESDPERVDYLVEEIKKLEAKIDKMKIEFTQQEYEANKLLPSNENEAMKIKNLVARGIKPIQTTVLAASLLSIPADGFAIGEKAEPGEPRAMPIAIGVEYPEGLVYRVQVGAFARPIPAELFSEFTPVSGEKIYGTNITRYMAGYFNDINRVVQAREQIKGLGYNDAFIVAYCNGKRIQWGEARRMEAQGICVPKRSEELILDIAEKTAENLGIDLDKGVVDVEEHDYNKAPGAADADAIEDMKGLFFTVQIGVFNRPVGEESLYGMKEILTIRLPNGQIRYATGIFNSVDKAMPRRREALNNGVIGAFVTAYYNGERIPLYQAIKILEEQGESVLFTSQTKKEEKPIENSVATNPIVKTEPIEVLEPVEEKRMPRVQIVTKKSFEEFPRDVLNRYNTEGTFFYDEDDGKVKSIIYQDVDHLPRVYNFRKDIDTIYFDLDQMTFDGSNVIEARIPQNTIPGDLMDWLLRLSYRKSIEQNGEELVLRIYDVMDDKQKEVMDRLRSFGYIPELVETVEE